MQHLHKLEGHNINDLLEVEDEVDEEETLDEELKREVEVVDEEDEDELYGLQQEY